MPTIEMLMLANHAEAVNGLLYVSGAGWTNLNRTVTAGAPPPMSTFGIAVSILVGWNETNEQHHFVLRLETEDAQELFRLEGGVEVGRPPGHPVGMEQRAVLAFNISQQFPTPGGYRVVGQLGEEIKSISFRVRDHQAPPSPPPPTVDG